MSVAVWRCHFTKPLMLLPAWFQGKDYVDIRILSGNSPGFLLLASPSGEYICSRARNSLLPACI